MAPAPLPSSSPSPPPADGRVASSSSSSRTQLALTLVALLAIAHTFAGPGGARSSISTISTNGAAATAAAAAAATLDADRFVCARSAGERDAARLDFARDLTRARPWLLRRVSAASPDAQALFSAGLLEAQGFNAAEAEAFALAALADSPRCGMCAWLSSYARGPTPNVVADARGSRAAGFPVFGPEDAAQADALAQRALELAQSPASSSSSPRSSSSSPVERRLIRALASRNRGAAALVAEAASGEPLPEPWRPRQEAYARELAALAAELEAGAGGAAAAAAADGGDGGDGNGNGNDKDNDAHHQLAADVLAFAGEAHLSLSPWDYYYYDARAGDGSDDGDGGSAAKPTPPLPLSDSAAPRGLLQKRLFGGLASSKTAAPPTTSAAVPRRGRALRLRPTAAEGERLLRAALRVDPRHPMALHLLVHVAEAGTPGPRPLPGAAAAKGRAEGAAATASTAAWRGEAAADALALLRLPQGHLLHMPSHVYVRVGRYRDALASNAAARRHDVAAASGGRCAPGYVPEHNAQLATYAAATAGMERAALASALGARRLRALVPDLYVARGREWTTVPLLRARFGDWRAVLLDEAPRSSSVGFRAEAGNDEADPDADDDADDPVADAEFARGPLMPPPPDARGRTLSGGRGFAQVVYHYVRLLALAARADAAAVRGDPSDGREDSPALQRAAVARELRALRRAAGDADALREPRTLPGGAPGLYASGNARLAPIYERIGTARSELAQVARWRAERERRWKQQQQQQEQQQEQQQQEQEQQEQQQQQQPQGGRGPPPASRAEAAAERRALAALSEAAELERALPYSEPPVLEAPASACLAWALLRAGGRAQEAAEAYARELAERHAENPWALAGLFEALEQRQQQLGQSVSGAPDGGLQEERQRELQEVRQRAERAGRDADAAVRSRFGIGGGKSGGGGGSSCPQLSAAWW